MEIGTRLQHKDYTDYRKKVTLIEIFVWLSKVEKGPEPPGVNEWMAYSGMLR
jgi:hypothetical protein